MCFCFERLFLFLSRFISLLFLLFLDVILIFTHLATPSLFNYYCLEVLRDSLSLWFYKGYRYAEFHGKKILPLAETLRKKIACSSELSWQERNTATSFRSPA